MTDRKQTPHSAPKQTQPNYDQSHHTSLGEGYKGFALESLEALCQCRHPCYLPGNFYPTCHMVWDGVNTKTFR